jgi:hypothetical protein
MVAAAAVGAAELAQLPGRVCCCSCQYDVATPLGSIVVVCGKETYTIASHLLAQQSLLCCCVVVPTALLFIQDAQLATFMNTARRQIKDLEDNVKELQKL